MAYNYETQKIIFLSERGIKTLLSVRDRAMKLLADKGSFRAQEAFVFGSTWDALACLDFMVELGEIKKIDDPLAPAQDWVFTR